MAGSVLPRKPRFGSVSWQRSCESGGPGWIRNSSACPRGVADVLRVFGARRWRSAPP